MSADTLSLSVALEEYVSVQAVVNDTVISVSDYTPSGYLVKVDGCEPEGINNMYGSTDEVEDDLVLVVEGYEKDMVVWQEVEDVYGMN